MPTILYAPQYRKIKSVTLSPTTVKNHSAGDCGNVSMKMELVNVYPNTSEITLKATLGVSYSSISSMTGSDTATFTIKLEN